MNASILLGNQFAIIEWEEEETASVVPCRHVGCGVFEVGEVSNVWTPQGRYKGRVAASGKRTKFTMHEMCFLHASQWIREA